MRPRIRLVAMPLIAALLSGACGGQPAASPSPAASAPPGPSLTPAPSQAVSPPPAALLLEVTTEGGFINPTASLGALPLVVVDADGRIFTPALSSDGLTLLIPAVEVRDTGTAGATAILAAIRDAGLGTEGAGGVAADTGRTVFTAAIDGDLVVSRFAAGGPGLPGGAGGPGAPALDLLARLLDPSVPWGSDTPAVPAPYAPDGYFVRIAPAGSAGTDAAPWPLATPPGEFGAPTEMDFGVADLRGGPVTGADAVTLAAALGTAPAGTLLAAGGTAWTAWIRPLFPDESAP